MYKINVPNVKTLLEQLADGEAWMLSTRRTHEYTSTFKIFVTAFDRKKRVLEYSYYVGSAASFDQEGFQQITQDCDKIMDRITKWLETKGVKVMKGFVCKESVSGEKFVDEKEGGPDA